ncbi:MAG: hypothetical protein OEQ94_00760 [Nitrosopumilus sp.]|nr:hypothetical protein [Nitrosopumilus sp.]MDH3822272.1 hypothetical protein [Nitrosopumilus sp.]MDH3833072.1 hypothetical protein [Nitrosopumilus sp.]
MNTKFLAGTFIAATLMISLLPITSFAEEPKEDVTIRYGQIKVDYNSSNGPQIECTEYRSDTICRLLFTVTNIADDEVKITQIALPEYICDDPNTRMIETCEYDRNVSFAPGQNKTVTQYLLDDDNIPLDVPPDLEGLVVSVEFEVTGEDGGNDQTPTNTITSTVQIVRSDVP